MIRSSSVFTLLFAAGATSARPGADGAEEYPDSRYTDRLGLLRIAGRWWIVSKLYVAERR